MTGSTDGSEYTDEELAAGEVLFARPWRFVKGVVALEGLPDDGRTEVALAGRSNVGKSSLINALVGNRTLARTSNTPGRTQELNFFEPADRSLYLVDMPGYGFANAPRDKVEAWTKLVKAYLSGRTRLRRVFLLIDSRHGIKAVDGEIMKLLDASGVSYQIVLTKADKPGGAQLAGVVDATRTALAKHAAAFPVLIVTSAETGEGLPELRATLARIARET